MSSVVLFPPLSKDTPDAEGVLATWFVADGDRVDRDQLLAEVQVDKVSAEVPSPSAGIVRLLVGEEATVTQGTPIARIEAAP
jgi:pyruvate/2-oxoglutarate dehydrogenase complex dihydrolipoamide acyltransferase (E2) component